MTQKNLSEYKRKYDVARHHAWAGSVLLAVLIAIRGFFQISNIKIEDKIIIAIGMILIFYILIAIFLTYKYRYGLLVEQKIVEVHIKTNDLEREKLKIEKKKAKADAKKSKKNSKK
jgi:amino acid permease